MVINAHSLAKPSAVQQLATDVQTCGADLVCVIETWLSTKHTDDYSSIDGYSIKRQYRKARKGGGVCVYLKK
jgi:hypothetical protein